MSEPLLNILKLCLLALLYLFFFRVLRAVWAEVATARPAEAKAKPRGRGNRRSDTTATKLPGGRRKRGSAPTDVIVVEPPEQAGRRYPLGDEVTVGRAAGCQIIIDDNYVSQLHARLFLRDGQLFVEDLGSTNGTYLNRGKVSGPMVMQRGDRLQVGNTVMEVA
ncbi:MAG: FHA domain-containing protein FhaB/FipA [Acidimicrobiales bacterium]